MIFKNPLFVYSVMNFCVILLYLPGLIPALSLIAALSGIKIKSSAKASTSYHLKSSSKNWFNEGKPLKLVPSSIMIDDIDKTSCSGNTISKNGLTSDVVVTFLKYFVTPFITISLFVIL